MRRVIVGIAVVFGIAAAVIGSDLFWWSRVVVVLAAATALAFAFRCRHPHPALQPPLHDESGERRQAHWYCHDCGRSWPAIFERERAPIVKYAGFDQAKAPEAERRARRLDVRRRELALDRAGLRPTTRTPAVVMRRRAERLTGDSARWRPGTGRTALELLHSSSLDDAGHEEPSPRSAARGGTR
jgi:hypothetical protein